MFDNKHVHVHEDRGPRNVFVTEVRAPTDDSVKLLTEMETAAQKRVDDAVRIEGNGFNCVVHFIREAMSDTIKAKAIFDLNGARLTVTAETPGGLSAGMSDPKRTLVFKLRDAMALEIASQVLLPALTKEFPF
jgi:hypothetical protein